MYVVGAQLLCEMLRMCSDCKVWSIMRWNKWRRKNGGIVWMQECTER